MQIPMSLEVAIQGISKQAKLLSEQVNTSKNYQYSLLCTLTLQLVAVNK